MRLIVDRLLDVPAEPRRLTVHRAVALAIDGTPAEDFVPDPSYAHPDSGRWATAAGTLYTAIGAETTWYEYCRWSAKDLKARPGWTRGIPSKMLPHVAYTAVGPPPPLRALVRLEFALQRVPDLTRALTTPILLSAGVDVAKLRSDDHGECQKLSAVAERLGWDAMMVPSAATDTLERVVPIFRNGRKRLIDQAVVASPAGPTVLQAMQTRFRDGERPSWLRVR